MQITLFSHRARGAHTQTHTYRWRPFAVLSFNVAEELRRNQLHSWALSLVLECLMPFLIVISFVVISYYYWFAFIFFYAIKFNWNVHSFYLLLLKQVIVVFWTIEEKNGWVIGFRLKHNAITAPLARLWYWFVVWVAWWYVLIAWSFPMRTSRQLILLLFVLFFLEFCEELNTKKKQKLNHNKVGLDLLQRTIRRWVIFHHDRTLCYPGLSHAHTPAFARTYLHDTISDITDGTRREWMKQ